MGRFQQVWNLLSPKSYAAAMNGTFRMFDDGAPPVQGQKPEALTAEPTSEQVALAALMKGVHY